MNFRHLLLISATALLLNGGAWGAQQDAVASSAAPSAAPALNPTAGSADQPLTGTVSDDRAWADLGIDIPAFATDTNRPTPANAGGSAALGLAVARVITDDLKNNGLFKPVGPDALPSVPFNTIATPDFDGWEARGAQMLVQGAVVIGDDGLLNIGCSLFDVKLKQALVHDSWVFQSQDWRRAAHKCADAVYARLSGENPFFDSRIAYIAETGPKRHRIKRLAVMDSDGANNHFITTGLAMALTPRFSPDYKKILYLSYLDGHPRIYVYDLARNTQKLLLATTHTTIAPRWSPDGQSILYSMSVGGSTNIYQMPVGGGPSVQLTDTPGINVGGSFSPDGSKITFESDRSGTQQVYVMNADGSDQRRISFFGGRSATPEWSPRGDLIAFTHMAGNLRIAVMTPSGSDLRYLTHGWQDEAPTWAPNGRVIQFFRTEPNSGKTSIWQVDVTGLHLRHLPTPVDASDPAWGPVLR